jgi:hypothetical protein
VSLTPGAVILPYTEHLVEQLGWIAEDIVQRGGDAYVLPVMELAEADEAGIRRRMREDRRLEYAQLREAASRTRDDREVAALMRALGRAVERDHFASTGRSGAERAISQAARRKETT